MALPFNWACHRKKDEEGDWIKLGDEFILKKEMRLCDYSSYGDWAVVAKYTVKLSHLFSGSTPGWGSRKQVSIDTCSEIRITWLTLR